MEDTIVFIDEGFLDKLNKFLGQGKRLKFDKIDFAMRISKQQDLLCKKLFYYTAPLFQSAISTEKENRLKEGYDKFINSLIKNKDIILREGRCQKIVNEQGSIEYNQKGVDTFLTLDLSHLKEDYPKIKKIILVSSDTDFCPAIRDIKKRSNIKVILYTYFDRKRKSKFSLSNELISCCSKYVKLTKEDFISCPLNKLKENIA